LKRARYSKGIVGKCVFVFLVLARPLAAQYPLPVVLSSERVVPSKGSLGLSSVPLAAENPPKAETILLGRRLFFDPILSGPHTFSCATCHQPQFAYADNRPLTAGAVGKTSVRNVPSVVNSAYFTSLFWDGRASSLEKQVQSPIESTDEMANTVPEVEKRLNADETYRQEFSEAWGPGPITFEMVEKSIASFERALVSGNSPFDRWKYGHDERAVSDSVKRGFVVFTSKKKGNCAVCHTVEAKCALFTDNKFHDIGVGVQSGKIADTGLYAITHNEADRGKFKTPSLRNVALTAPYMHDGSLRDLKQVMDFYVGGGSSHPNLDREIHPLEFLTGQERRDLLAFLNSLTGEMPVDARTLYMKEAFPGAAQSHRHSNASTPPGPVRNDSH
jgi:cytochrome c peroxidase